MESKFCFACKILKNKTAFGIARGRSDGVQVYCKQCTSDKNATKYANNQVWHTCKKCMVEFVSGANKLFCSPLCAGAKRRKGIDGYHTCLVCSKEFPFRKSLIKRGQGKIAYATQKYCSGLCKNKALQERNKIWRPTQEMIEASRIRTKLLFTGKKYSVEQRLLRSNKNKGAKSHFWRGGIAPLNKVIRNSIEYRLWREAVFVRDNWTCQICEERGGKLNADHIKPFALFPELRTSIENGRTLCVPCHKKTDTYAGRTKAKFQRIAA